MVIKESFFLTADDTDVLAAPSRLWVANEDEVGLRIVISAYRAAGVLGNLTIEPESSPSAAIDWLLGE